MSNSSFLVFTFIIVTILFPTTVAITTITIWSICSWHFSAIVHQRPSHPRPRTSSSSSTGRSAGSGRSTNAPAARVALVWRPPELHIWPVDGRRLWSFWQFFRFFLRKSGVRASWLSTDRAGSTSPEIHWANHVSNAYIACHSDVWVYLRAEGLMWSATFEFGRMSEILEPQEPSHDCSSLSQWPFQEPNLEHI